MPFILSGCISTVELRDRAIVECLGIDFSDDYYFITLQVYNNNTADGGTENKQSNNKILTSNGRTLSDTIYNAANLCGKYIFLGNCKSIIIGKDAAQQKIFDIVSFFNSNYQTRIKTKLLVCDNSAKDFVSAKSESGNLINPQEVVDMAKLSEKMGLIGGSDILTVVSSMNNDINNGFLLGYISYAEKNDDIKSQIIGNALFNNENFVGIIDETQARGSHWINSKIPWTIITAKKENGEDISIIAKNASSKIKCKVEQNQLKVNIKIKFDANLSELTELTASSNKEELDIIEQICENQVKKEVEAAIEECVFKKGCDVFNFNEYASLRYVNFVTSNTENWNEIMKNSVFNVAVECKLERMALVSNNPKK